MCCSLHLECSPQSSLSFPLTLEFSSVITSLGNVESFYYNSEVQVEVSLDEHVLTRVASTLHCCSRRHWVAHYMHDALQALDSQQGVYSLLGK